MTLRLTWASKQPSYIQSKPQGTYANKLLAPGTHRVKSRAHGLMGGSNTYWKDQVPEFTEHTRAGQGMMYPFHLGHIEGGVPGTGVQLCILTLHQTSGGGVMGSTGDKLAALSPGLQLNLIPLLGTAHLN
jgi:hypothetical protein